MQEHLPPHTALRMLLNASYVHALNACTEVVPGVPVHMHATHAHMQAVDVLTPLAHGCALLAAGADPSATTDLLMRVTAHLSHPSDSSSDSNNPEHLRVVYVAAGCSQEELDRRVERLEVGTGICLFQKKIQDPDVFSVLFLS